jgi:hypothetical protein
MFQGPPEAVQLGDHQLVPGTVGRQQGPLELGPRGQDTGSLVDVNRLAPGSSQGVVLGDGVSGRGWRRVRSRSSYP